MNGVHDLGGMHGFGSVAPSIGEPAFHAPWEERVFAMAVSVRPGGIRRLIEQLPPAEYLEKGYYERWLAALEERLIAAAGLTREEIEAKAAYYAAHPEAPVPRRLDPALAEGTAARLRRHEWERLDVPGSPGVSGLPGATEATAVAARFAVGDSVRARNVHPKGHTRLPRYVRGRRGTIARVHGIYEIDDDPWEGMQEGPQAMYAVRVDLVELWGPGHGAQQDGVYVDLWESHLEPA
jgi:nitrile hydratase